MHFSNGVLEERRGLHSHREVTRSASSGIAVHCRGKRERTTWREHADDAPQIQIDWLQHVDCQRVVSAVYGTDDALHVIDGDTAITVLRKKCVAT